MANNSSSSHEKPHHHAHFIDPKDEVSEDDLVAHEAKIKIDYLGASLGVRLGFLQIKHIYEVRFKINDELGNDVIFDQLENIHVKIESAESLKEGDGHDIVLTFNASKEKIMKEKVTLYSNDKSKSLGLVLQARVLGKGKGTPSLKEGIHCLKVEWDEESEASDWQGF